MERAKIPQEALIATLVEVTPAQLREMANLLELSTQRATETETVLVKFTDRITLVYKPSVKVAEQLKERLANFSSVKPVGESKPVPIF